MILIVDFSFSIKTSVIMLLYEDYFILSYLESRHIDNNIYFRKNYFCIRLDKSVVCIYLIYDVNLILIVYYPIFNIVLYCQLPIINPFDQFHMTRN